MYTEFKGEEFSNMGMEFDRHVTQISIEKMVKIGKVIVCETDNSIVCMLAGLLSQSMTSTDLYFVGCLFFVQKSFRSFTSNFLRDCKTLLKSTHATQFVLAVPAFSDAEKSERFYSIQGFKPLETHWITKL